MGREIESRQGLGWELDPNKKKSEIECFIFSVHTGLTQALSTTLGETTWIGEAAK
jgi:hypothetical protein